MEATDLIKKLSKNNILISLDGQQLKVKFRKEIEAKGILEEIKANKDMLIHYLKKYEVKEKYQTIPKAPAQEAYPLSAGQLRIWLGSQVGKSSLAYNLPQSIRLAGGYHLESLQRAIDAVIERHEILRTVFRADDDGEIRQYILPRTALDFKVNIEDLRELPDAQQYINDYIEVDKTSPFDLENGPLIKVVLFLLSEEELVYYQNIHHIISDSWSKDVLFKDLKRHYEAYRKKRPPQIDPLRIQYKDYSCWQKDSFSGKAYSASKEYWTQKLSGELPRLEFPSLAQKSTKGNRVGHKLSYCFPKHIAQNLRQFSKQESGSLFMGILATLSTLFYRYTGQKDILMLSPVAGRNHPDLENQIGYYVNTLALRNHVDPEDSFRSHFAQVRATTMEAYTHQLYPFDHLMRQLGQAEDNGQTTISNVLVNLLNTGNKESNAEIDQALISQFRDEGEVILRFDLEFDFEELGDFLQLRIVFNKDLYTRETLEQFIRHYAQLVKEAIASPDKDIKAINFMSNEEKQQLISQINATSQPHDLESTLIELFHQQVQQHPERTALVYEEHQYTYEELDQWSDQVSSYLKQTYSFRQNDLIGIHLERSEWIIICMLGILKSGAAYLPIDPGAPLHRRKYIEKDSNCKAVIDQKDINLFTENYHLDRPVEKPVLKEASSSDLAYVLYTSGSTGQPKGVVVNQRSVLNLMGSLRGFDYGSVAMTTKYIFDVSVYEIYGALLYGNTLYIPPGEVLNSGIEYARYIQKNRIGACYIQPFHLKEVAEQLAKYPRTYLKRVLLGVEPIDCSLLKFYLDQGIEVHNAYGPTEATVYCTELEAHKATLNPNQIVPIGYPIDNGQIYLLDEYQNLVPFGVAGEIHVGGEGLAVGYLNNPPLTAQKFIAHPFDNTPDARLYRTGDLARWLPKNGLKFLGRKDKQVKVLGHRIELSGIETILAKYPNVQHTVVAVRKNKEGENTLVAYLLPSKKQLKPFDKSKIIAYLKQYLPHYMIPYMMVELEELPLTPSGKIARKRLPPPTEENILRLEYLPPRNDTEQKLLHLWMELFQFEKIGIRDNFFELGGHSLSALRLTTAVRKTFQRDLTVADIFSNPTIESQSLLLQTKEENSPLPAISALPRPSRIPLSNAQERLWFIDQLEGSLQYHMPLVVQLKEELNRADVEEAFRLLLERHEILRTVIKTDQDQPYQEILPAQQWKLHYRDLSGTEGDAALKRGMAQEIERPFDLAKDYMLRAHLIKVAQETHYLMLLVHHIASDGWSQSILVRDLTEIFEAKVSGREVKLPELPVQYADYAIWQNKAITKEASKANLNWWIKKLDQVPILELPTDFARPARQSFRGGSELIRTDKDLYQALSALALQTNTSLFMVLLAACKVLLYRYTGQQDFCVGTPVSNRNQKEVEELIGLFLNTIALRDKIEEEQTFLTFLAQVKENTLAAFDRQEVPFAEIVKKVVSDRVMNHSPVFQVLFILQNTPDVSGESSSKLNRQAVAAEQATAQHDLSFSITESSDGLVIGLEYCTDLFEAATIKRMLEHFSLLLESIVQNPAEQVHRLAIIGASERRQLLVDFNETEALVFDENKPLLALFEDQVLATPSQVCLIHEGERITYQDLNERAKQLALYLKTTKAVSPGAIMGILLEHGPWAITAILAVLKLQGIYVPIDEDNPKERIDYMLQNSGSSLLIDHNLIEQFQQEHTAGSFEAVAAEVEQSQPLAIIYTSGSSGVPKGVPIFQKGLLNRLSWMWERYPFEEGEVCSVKTSLGFVDHLWEIFGPLLKGIPLVLFNKKMLLNQDQFIQQLSTNKVSRIVLVPSLLKAMLRHKDACREQLPYLRYWTCSGEKLTATLVEQFFDTFENRKLLNIYGSTEITADATCYDLSLNTEKGTGTNRRIPIGRPIHGFQIYVLDTRMELVPIGVPGELYISGIGNAGSYWNLPDLSRAKFLDHPFEPDGGKLFKTGDQGRWLSDGTIEILDRKDHQVKIRGYRVELEEIERALLAVEPILDGVVVAKDLGRGAKELIGYVVLQDPDGNQNYKRQLETDLRRTLPSYMIPVHWMELEALPLTDSGKIDRRALPDPIRSVSKAIPLVAPQNDIERAIAAIWKDVLGLEELGIDDNFFELGGHSLNSFSVLAKMNKVLDKELPLMELFSNPTIRQIAALYQQNQKSESSIIPLGFAKTHLENLFFIPPIIGLPLIFSPLAKALSEQFNSFGLRYLGLESETSLETSIDQIAARITAEILKQQQSGRYILCGYSMGATVAFEVARKLEGNGHTVALILLDQLVLGGHKASKAQLAEQSAHFSNWLQQELEKAAITAISHSAIQSFIANNLKLLATYQTSGKIQGPILGVETKEGKTRSFMKAWQGHTDSSFEHRWIEGNHFQVLDKGQIPILQHLISEFIPKPIDL